MSDTICAISTSLGVGAISIIRISGPQSINIVNKIYHGKNLTKVNSHTINYGHIYNDKELIDEVLVSVMKKPKTFTREDLVEINCHGGIVTTKKILELLLKNGARLAEPGEFTKRAFLNGRIDLIEAEAVMDLINTKTEKAAKIALNQLQGESSRLVRDLRREILELLANIEVNIDYPEYEDIEEVTDQHLKQFLPQFRQKLENIVYNYENSKLIKEGIKTVIIGRPNVGKSSILNSLLDEDKAIVTDIPGTTRDLVEGNIMIDGIPLNIVDTAGIRNAKNDIEKIGIEKSLKEINNADLVLVILAHDENLTKEDEELIKKVGSKKHIIVINKNDLNKKINLERIDQQNLVLVSTKTKNGLDPLKAKIREMFNLGELEQADYTYLSNARQIALIKTSLQIVNDIEAGLKQKLPVDLLEIDLKKIWQQLGEIIGETYTDELLDQLFSQFCLGK